MTADTLSPPPSHTARVRTELRGLLLLATPIIIAQLATTAMGFVDAVMAGRVSPRDLAAVALGNSIWIPVFLLMTGILLATTPKVAQRFGAGQHGDQVEVAAAGGGAGSPVGGDLGGAVVVAFVGGCGGGEQQGRQGGGEPCRGGADHSMAPFR